MTNQPLLGRCKECDYALFATDEDLVQAESFRDIKQTGVVYRMLLPLEAFFARCPQRHKVFVLNRIKGTYSKDHKCDARCLNAKGHDCTCSCGGANHGRGHTAVHVATEKVQLLVGEVGKTIRGTAKVASKRDITDATLYTFVNPAGTVTIKWFAPSYANPDYAIGQEVNFRARVKKHEDNEYGKATIVTYLEEV
jgi:hypothetical protein